MQSPKSVAARLIRVNADDWFMLDIDPEWRKDDPARFHLCNGVSMGPDYRYAETALRDWNQERAKHGLNQFYIVESFGV